MGDSLDDQLAQLEAITTQRARLQPPTSRPFNQPAGVPAVVAQAAQRPPAPQPRSLLDRAGDFLKGVGSGAAKLATDPGTYTGGLAGIVRAPGQIIGGTLDTAADAGRFIGDNIDAAFVRGSPLNSALKQTIAQTQVGAFTDAAQAIQGLARLHGGSSLADVLSARKSLGQVGRPGVNQFMAEATGIAARLPFGGEGAAPEAAGWLVRVAKGAGDLLLNSAKVGAATAIVADPRAARISNLIQSAGVHNAVIDYLAGDDSDPDLVKRFKSGVEGAIGNAALEPIFMGLGRALKAALRGDAAGVTEGFGTLPHSPEPTVSEATPLEAAADHLDRTFATGRTQEARYEKAEAQASSAAEAPAVTPGRPVAGSEPQGGPSVAPPSDAAPGAPQGEVPTASPEVATPEAATTSGTRHTDAPTPSNDRAKVAADANSLLAKAGASERLDPETMQVGSDGRIFVDPRTKAALDDQGLGRAFAPRSTAVAPAAAPPGPGDLWRLTPEELDQHAAEKAMSDREKLVQALGEDGAKEFERLDRMRNSSQPSRADEGSRLFDERFGALTPEQERLVYGIGETSASLDDIRSVLAAHHDVMAGDSEQWLSYMAAVGARKLKPGDLAAVTKGEATPEVQASFVRLGRAYEGLTQAGVPAGEIPQRMADALVTHAGWRPEQAEEIIGGFVRDLLDSRRAAAADGLAPKMLFKETDAEGGSRVVGALDREGVQAFASRVAELRDAAVEAGDPNILDVRHASAGDGLGTVETAGRSGEWKVANLGAPYDVAPTIRALIDQVPQRVRPKSDLELMQAAKGVYDSVGIAPQDALEYAAKVAGQSRDLDTALVVVRTLWADAGRALDDLTGLDVSTFTDDAVKDAAERIHHAMMLSLDMADTKAGLGRAMRAQQLPDLATYLDNFGRVPEHELAPKAVGELPPLPRTPEELQQWLDLWGAMKADPVGRQRFLQGLTFVPGKWSVLRNSFPNFFVASLVSAPSTFARDLAGPAIVGALRTIERTAGGYAASLNPFNSPQTRTELLAAATQAPAAYVRTLADIGDAFRYAVQATKQGHGVLGGPNPVDFNRAARIPQAMIDAAMAKTGPGVTGDIPYILGNLINAWPRAVHALHGGVNEFAQRLAYNGEIRAQAMLEASERGLTDPQDVRRFILDKLDAAGDPLTGAATNETALQSSRRTTFTQDVGGGEVTRGFAKWIGAAKTNVPELNYILPIFRVPANALGETIRRIPVVGQLFKETRDELAGKLGAGVQAEAYGRFLSGAALMGAGFVMARNGTLTGAGPQEPAARKLWLETHEPYSIRVGDKWVGFNRLDVMGQLLGIAASTYDRSVYRAQDNGNAIYAGVGAFAQYFKDQAALQGVADLLSFGGNPTEDQGYLARLTQGIASGFVPNFITQLGRNNLDPNARVVHAETLDTSLDQGVIPALGGAVHSLASGAWQAVLNKLPGGSALLDPQRNLLGEEVYKVQNAAWNSLPISLSNVNTYAKDPVLDELARLYEETGYAPGVPSGAAGKGQFDTRDVKLEDGRSLYDALLRHRMTVTLDGQTLREALTSAITSPEYLDAVDGTGRRETDEGQTTRAGMLGRIFADYSKAAKQATAGESPVASRWLAVADAKDQDNAALRPYSAQQLVSQPALLRALNIPIEEHEDKVRGDYAPAQ